MKKITSQENMGFETLKLTNEHGAEFWRARDLQPLLGYTQWRRFQEAVQRAILSCELSGNDPKYHFAGAGNMIAIGKNALREIEDFHLSRFACYLIAQNGDPRKIEIAQAQKYFAIQARRQEVSDQAAADFERIELRRQTSEEFKALSGAAQEAGVQAKMFGVFHDAGYKGLYGGLSSAAIKKRKSISEKENLLDRMNATELAANQFRMTQTRERLIKRNVHSQTQAIQTHEVVGQEVRNAIKKIGGTLPEKIPAAEHIRTVVERVKLAAPKLKLEEGVSGGLLGGQKRSRNK